MHSAFHGVIIGGKGSTRKRIESETKTTIKVPKAGENGNIEIIGATKQSVSSARRRVDMIVLATRTKQQSTHFMCVPVIQSAIKENYVKFMVREAVGLRYERKLCAFFSDCSVKF